MESTTIPDSHQMMRRAHATMTDASYAGDTGAAANSRELLHTYALASIAESLREISRHATAISKAMKDERPSP